MITELLLIGSGSAASFILMGLGKLGKNKSQQQLISPSGHVILPFFEIFSHAWECPYCSKIQQQTLKIDLCSCDEFYDMHFHLQCGISCNKGGCGGQTIIIAKNSQI